MFGKNEFLGEILVPLKDRVFDDPNPGWWDLQEMVKQLVFIVKFFLEFFLV